MKKANPSAENGRPKMPPENTMKRGQRRPSSKDRTVPETAPTAKRIPNALDHRRASTIHASSRRHRARPSATDMSSGMPTPSTAKTMWKPSEVPIVARARVTLSTRLHCATGQAGSALGLNLHADVFARKSQRADSERHGAHREHAQYRCHLQAVQQR